MIFIRILVDFKFFGYFFHSVRDFDCWFCLVSHHPLVSCNVVLQVDLVKRLMAIKLTSIPLFDLITVMSFDVRCVRVVLTQTRFECYARVS